MKQLTINLTIEEAEVLDDYIERKCYKLEQSGLTNSKCYPLLYSVHRKIKRAHKIPVSIGDEIYIVYKDSISKHDVTMLGKEMFCHSDSFDDCYVDDYHFRLRYDEENEVWFRTLNAAKHKVKEVYGKCTFRKFPNEDYWEAQSK